MVPSARNWAVLGRLHSQGPAAIVCHIHYVASCCFQEAFEGTTYFKCSCMHVYCSVCLQCSFISSLLQSATFWLCPGMPVWVSFTLEDSTACCLRDKQPLAAAVQQLTDRANLTAVLVNCCAPTAVAAAIPVLKQHLPSGKQATSFHCFRPWSSYILR